MSRMLRTGAVVALGVLVMSGCAPAEPQTEPAPTSAAPTGTEQRSVDDVQAAAAALDPCALLDAEVAAELGISTPAEAGLFTCTIDDSVQVSVHVPFTQDDRAQQQETAVGGALAYRTDEALQSCDIALPTSTDTAIVFDQHEYGAPYDCAEVEAFAAAAAQALLDDPASLRRADGGDGIVACDVFEPVSGPAPSGTEFRPKTVVAGWGLDSCGLWAEPDSSGFEPVEPESSLWLVRRAPMAEWSAQGGWDKYEKTQLAGRDVLVMPQGEGACDLFFDAWPSRENAAQVIGAVVTAPDCAAAHDLVTELAPSLEKAAPVVPQAGVLLYAEGESDPSDAEG